MKPVLAAIFSVLIAGAAGCRIGGPPSVSGPLSVHDAPAAQVVESELGIVPGGSPVPTVAGASAGSVVGQGVSPDGLEASVGQAPDADERMTRRAAGDFRTVGAQAALTPRGAAGNASLVRPSKNAAGGLPFSLALVLPSAENNGGDVLRRRLVAAAGLGAARILLPPPVELTPEGIFILNEIPSGFGPADIAAPVLLWTDFASADRSSFGVLADGETGSVLFLSGPAMTPAQAGQALDQLKQFLRKQAGRGKSYTLILDRALWSAAPSLWREVAAALRQAGSAAVIAFVDTPALLWQQHGGIDCLATPRRVIRDDPGVLWLSLSRAGPKVSLLRSASVSDIRRFDRQVQEEHDRLVKSLTTTPVSGLKPETTVRFKNTMNRVLDLRAEWSFSDPNALAVQPQILGFQLEPGEEFRQDFRFQLEAGSILKFQRPRFRLSTEVSDGTGGQSPLVIQAVPWCCMRGEVQSVETDIRVDGDPSEWAGRGYPLNHESQVLEGLDAWQGPADLSANLFVSRTADALLIGAQVYDDRHSDAEIDSWVSFHLAVDLGAAEAEDLPATPARLDLAFDPQAGLVTAPELKDLQSAWTETEEAMLIEASIPLSHFAGEGPLSLVRVDASLSEPVGENGRVSLVFSGRDPALGDPSLFGTFRIVRNGGDAE